MTPFDQRLQTALLAADWPASVLARTSVAALVGALRASMAPLVAGWIVADTPQPGRSKLGGLPDLPSDIAWPCSSEHGEPLAFICQIDLTQLVGLDARARLPRRGMLYLFSICDNDAAYGWEIGPDTSAVVYAESQAALGSLAPRAWPQRLPAHCRLVEQELAFAQSVRCELLRPDGDQYAAQRFDYAIEQQLASVLAQLGSRVPEVRLLAHAHFFRPELRVEYDPDREIELLGFAGALASPQFGEGEFHLIISDSELAQGALDKARVLFEPGT